MTTTQITRTVTTETAKELQEQVKALTAVWKALPTSDETFHLAQLIAELTDQLEDIQQALREQARRDEISTITVTPIARARRH